MSEPKYGDILEQEVDVDSPEVTALVCRLADRQTEVAYYRGRCETLEQVIAEIKASHQREIDSIIGANDIALGYLKDRLNRLESKGRQE